jgi:hypothetical protein
MNKFIIDKDGHLSHNPDYEETEYKTGDIVRFKRDKEIFGLYEVTGYSADNEITLTKDECNSEFYADENDLILVCRFGFRNDI